MKKGLCLLSIVILLSGILSQKANAQTDVSVSYQEFYDNLSPYGQWINDPANGYVWIPNVDDDFRPYFTEGHWVMTEYGNTWVSDYPWGWACFHYGRWIYNDYYGWIWVPGYEWGPGWVAWRWGDGFCGWAPLYPGIFWLGVDYSCPEDWWIFMHPRHFYKPRYHNVWRSDFMHGPRHTHTLIQRSHFVPNTYENNNIKYYSGPRAAEVQQVTHQPVQVYKMGNTTVRGGDNINNNTVNIYRPQKFEEVTPGSNRPAPANTIQAPRPIGRPSDVKIKWDQPRPFKSNIQKQNPAWSRPFIRNAPPYNNQPNPARQPGNKPAPIPQPSRQPVRQPSAMPPMHQPSPQPRSPAPAPAPRHR